jgi:hypothetical protein
LRSVKQRFLLAIVGLALLAGAVNVASASLPTEHLLPGTDEHATFVAPHEANIATPTTTGTRQRHLNQFGALVAFLGLLLVAAFSVLASVRAPGGRRDGRFFARRRGPPRYLVAA